MKKQILKPENWQDFEELCKVLWGDIWQCAEIKKNGRSGQNQKGVDIYGIPKGEGGYYGIQCKGKDEYSKAILTAKEINTEIEKAKSFRPALRKFYFATTANKDEQLEEYIREKNIEHLQQGLFEVHLFCWEDIAYLIEQSKRTTDWYIRKMNFTSQFKVSVTFEDDTTVKEFLPELVQQHVTYKVRAEDYSHRDPKYYRPAEDIRKSRIDIDTEVQPVHHFMNGSTRNLASCVFSVKLKNTGSQPLENFKLYLSFHDDYYQSEKVWKSRQFLDTMKYDYNIRWIKNADQLEFTEQNGVLVQDDELLTDKICIRPDIEFPFCVLIPWKLVCKDFSCEGLLRVVLNTTVTEKNKVETYDTPFVNDTRLINLTRSYSTDE